MAYRAYVSSRFRRDEASSKSSGAIAENEPTLLVTQTYHWSDCCDKEPRDCEPLADAEV